jgi:16S rRNA (guanine527-N7)-methyltransferase
MRELTHHALSLFGLRLSATQRRLFQIYETELITWNQQINLTSIDTTEQIRTKHFLDSLSTICVLRGSPLNSLVDIGTGAGFPGIPLKILFPEMHLTLIESVGKKAAFCQHLVGCLGLSGVEIFTERAESLGQNPYHRERYDWAIARAVAILPVLAEYLLPFVRVGGAMLAMKGEQAPAEVHRAEHAIKVLGGHVRKLTPITLPGVADERYLIVVDKIAATPPPYPRRVGLPSKKPL